MLQAVAIIDDARRRWRIVPGFRGLALTEACERLAVSGVKSMLTLFLIDRLLKVQVGDALGLNTMRAVSGHLFGPLSDIALASQLYGLQSALLYLSVPIGGLVGDFLIGRRALALAGGAMMALGGAAMAGDYLFLPGLLLFATGAGCLKGSLAAQVGALFDDETARRRGFAVYLAFLNSGVFLGPLVCGTLASLLGWSFGFGAAACAGVSALAVYSLTTRRRCSPRAAQPVAEGPRWTREAACRLPVIVVGITAVFLCFAAYEQLANMVLFWARHRIDLRIGGWRVPISWLVSLDGLLTIALIPLSELVPRSMQRHDLTRIALGCCLCAAGYLVLAGVALAHFDGLGWLLLYLLLIDSAIVLVWPARLSLIAAHAPSGFAGLMIGIFYLHGFVASLWVGASGAFYEDLGPVRFWLLHAAIALAGALVVAFAGPPAARLARRTPLTR